MKEIVSVVTKLKKQILTDEMARTKKIKPSQAEWHCGRLNKKCTAEMNAYAINGNWLCPCGNFIKDTSHLHRMIRQSDRIPDDTEKEFVTPTIYVEKELKEYIVYYWINHKEETQIFKAYNEDDLRKKLNKSFIGLLPYAAFKIRKNEECNLQVLVN